LKKKYLDWEYIIKEFIQTLQIACPLPNLTIEWSNSGMGSNGPEI
jgi:hypothetical protein